MKHVTVRAQHGGGSFHQLILIGRHKWDPGCGDGVVR
jgi:hypothetical protein